MRNILVLIFLSVTFLGQAQSIDRQTVLHRNNPHITAVDTLGSLTVGNGHFATTVDVTGLQSFPEAYQNGVPLCAMSDWGWHSFPNTKNLKPEDTQKAVDLGHGHKEIYAVEYKKVGRNKDATEYFRVNPHRLNLGNMGFLFWHNGKAVPLEEIQDIDQTLNLYDGNISSRYKVNDTPVEVTTAAHQTLSALFFTAKTKLFRKGEAKILLRLPYPTGKHADAASDWRSVDRHSSKVISKGKGYAIIEHHIDTTTYYITLQWQGKAVFSANEKQHAYTIQPTADSISVCVEYTQTKPTAPVDYSLCTIHNSLSTKKFWHNWWKEGAFADFSQCTDPRARELERRVVLSQYLTYVNCAGNTPPQETGLTYNSWYGRPHLEMTWWHLVDFSLWNHPDVLKRIMDWYTDTAYPYAKAIAERQGFRGVRWMKMTDPWVGESPSNVGSFLTWQQPHYIYMAEELYRRNPSQVTLSRYGKAVEETAEFLADFALSCNQGTINHKPYTIHHKPYTINLYGQTAMQESMNKDIAFCQPFEQAYFVYGLSTAQKWRERQGLPRNKEWDKVINNMAPLAKSDSIYCSGLPTKSHETKIHVESGASTTKSHVESGVSTFDPFNYNAAPTGKSISEEEFLLKSRSDHPAVLGACGLLPDYSLFNRETMKKTLDWVFENWNWATTWGWDYGMTAMCAARLGDGESAIRALLIDKGKNTYLVNGHNYQEPKRLRLYLPGNGALLDAVAMMCAGWDGCPDIKNPGFPQDGKWNVMWEGLHRMQ